MRRFSLQSTSYAQQPDIISSETDLSIVYTCPIKLNGRRTNLRIRVYNDWSVSVEGAWDGIDENGIAAKEIKKLSEGDVVSPVYYLDDDSEYTADECVWESGDNVDYTYLPAADYYYGFEIDDVYGDYYLSDIVVFGIDDNGNITFEE